jgi:hypothetical protein
VSINFKKRKPDYELARQTKTTTPLVAIKCQIMPKYLWREYRVKDVEKINKIAAIGFKTGKGAKKRKLTLLNSRTAPFAKQSNECIIGELELLSDGFFERQEEIFLFQRPRVKAEKFALLLVS